MQLQLVDPQLRVRVGHPIKIRNGQIKRLRIHLQKLGLQRLLAKRGRVAISIILANTPVAQPQRRHQPYPDPTAHQPKYKSQHRAHTTHLFAGGAGDQLVLVQRIPGQPPRHAVKNGDDQPIEAQHKAAITAIQVAQLVGDHSGQIRALKQRVANIQRLPDHKEGWQRFTTNLYWADTLCTLRVVQDKEVS